MDNVNTSRELRAICIDHQLTLPAVLSSPAPDLELSAPDTYEAQCPDKVTSW